MLNNFPVNHVPVNTTGNNLFFDNEISTALTILVKIGGNLTSKITHDRLPCDPSVGRPLTGVWKRGGGDREGNGVNSPQRLKPFRVDLSSSPWRIYAIVTLWLKYT